MVILYLIHHMSFKHIKKLNHIVMSLKILLILTIIIILIQLKEEWLFFQHIYHITYKKINQVKWKWNDDLFDQRFKSMKTWAAYKCEIVCAHYTHHGNYIAMRSSQIKIEFARSGVEIGKLHCNAFRKLMKVKVRAYVHQSNDTRH